MTKESAEIINFEGSSICPFIQFLSMLGKGQILGFVLPLLYRTVFESLSSSRLSLAGRAGQCALSVQVGNSIFLYLQSCPLLRSCFQEQQSPVSEGRY